MNPLRRPLPLFHWAFSRGVGTITCLAFLLLTGASRVVAQTPNQPPVVRITAPAEQAEVVNTNDLAIAVEASDPDGKVVRVALYRDGLFLGQSLSAPYLFTLIRPAAGTNVFKAVATDNQGGTAESPPVTVVVTAPLTPYSPPQVSLERIGTDRVLTAPATVSLTASASVYRDGLDRLEYQAAYGPLGSTPLTVGEIRSNPGTLTLTNLAVGTYVFTAVVRDIYGGSATSAPVSVTVVPPSGLVVPSFRFTDLGVLGGGESSGTAINRSGSVVGTSTLEANSGEQSAFVWQAGLLRSLPYAEGLTYGLGLNDLGQVSGSLAQDGRLAGAFVWTPAAGLTVLPRVGSMAEAYALNSEGLAVGWSAVQQWVRSPVVWSFDPVSNRPPEITVLSPGTFGEARAVNAAGQIAGFVSKSELGFGPYRAVLWDRGQERDLGVAAALGGEQSWALGLNALGSVVGQVSLAAPVVRGFLWDRGVVHELMPLVGSSGWPSAINDRGWSVGFSKPDRQAFLPEHAMLWLGRVPFDLNTLVTNLNGAILLGANAINESGQIAGTALVNGQRHACLLTPVPAEDRPAAPVVELANPLPGVTVGVGEPVALLASVQPGSARVARVDFYAGHTVVATVRSIPYAATWKPTVAGPVCLRALVIDVDGQASASGAACLTVEAAAPRYLFADLGVLARLQARGSGLNANGDFVGQARTDAGDAGFIFQGGVITHLQLPGPTANQALDINTAGQVLVWDNGRAGIHQNGAITWLKPFPAGSPESLGRAINGTGTVVGESRTDSGETHAALFAGNAVTDLGATLGKQSQANAINDAGVVVGWSQSEPGQPALSFIRQPSGVLSQFGSSLGGSIAQATGINAAGVVIGNASNSDGRQHAFVYQDGILRSLGTLGGLNSFARDINGSNQVVGTSDDEYSNRQAFLHEAGVMTALARLLPATNTAVLTEAVAINDRGQILANGNYGPADPTPRVFLLNPVPSGGRSNEAPDVSVQLPAGAIHDDGDSIPLQASVSDRDGVVAMVLFSTGDRTLGSVVHPPYTLTWTNVPPGSYPIVATAFDTLGARSTSAPVTVTVRAFDPSAPAVAVVGLGPAEYQADIRRNLQQTHLFSRVDLVGSLPTAGKLSEYDAVLVYSQTLDPFAAQLGDRLADSVDHGRGVVVALNASDTSHPVLQGRWRGEGYVTWSNERINGHGHEVMLKDQPGHPILEGVATFDGGISANYAELMTLAPGAVQVASWDTHDPLVVTREVGAGRVVGLNLNPVSSAAIGSGWDVRSDGARLMANALIWAGSAPSNRFSLAILGTNGNAYIPGEPVVVKAQGVNLAQGGVIRFYGDGTLLGSVTNLPATFTWTQPPVGRHLIVATHTDASGRVVATPGVAITVDSRQSVTLLTPLDGSVYYLPTNIVMKVAWTNLDAAVVRVDYYLDQTQRLASVTNAPFSFDFKLLPTGTFAISAVAFDAFGASKSSAAHTVTIVNTALAHLTEWKGTSGDWLTLSNWTAGPPRVQDPALIRKGSVRVQSPALAAGLVVGRGGSASIALTGGSLAVKGQLLLGDTAGSSGALRLDAPAILTAGEWVLGLLGKGDVVQNGGSATAPQLILAGDFGGTGGYELNGGVLKSGDEVVGGLGVGRFIQRGGTHEISEILRVGLRNGSRGIYELTGGRLETRFESIGATGTSGTNRPSVLQTGGIHVVREELLVGYQGAEGRLAVSGGLLQVSGLILDGSWMDLVADPSTNRIQVSGTARLGGVLNLDLAPGYRPLGGDTITLMTYGNRQGTFGRTNFPVTANGVVWSLEYQPQALVLRACPPPEVVLVGPITANPEPGLFQQVITLSNHGTEPLQGSRIYFPGLPAGWQLYNTSGTEEGVPFAEVNRLIPPASSIQFIVQFLVPAGVRPAGQDFVVRLGSVSGVGKPPQPLRFTRALHRPDQALELQFASEMNRTYGIEYSDDLLTWKRVPLPIVATGGQTQWVDDGPPKTTTRPEAEPIRLYRVVRIP
jgi:probable HAF family extracellular repeat protein